MSAVTKRTLRGTFKVVDVERETQYSATTDIYGMKWNIRVDKVKDHEGDRLGVYHNTGGPSFADNRSTQWRAHCKFTITLLPDNELITFDYTLKKDCQSRGPRDRMPWATLIDPANGYCIDGAFAVKIDVEISKPQFSADGTIWHDHKVQTPICFGDAFDDMAIGIADEKIRCHKVVVCTQSKVIFAAMTNEATDTFKTELFPIGHAAATVDNVRLFVRAMYGWRGDTMDEHAGDLLQLAHCYDADDVMGRSVDALQRLLTADTFWRTLRAGVALRSTSVGQDVVDMCAAFAHDPPTKVFELAARADGRAALAEVNCDCVRALMQAIVTKYE